MGSLGRLAGREEINPPSRHYSGCSGNKISLLNPDGKNEARHRCRILPRLTSRQPLPYFREFGDDFALRRRCTASPVGDTPTQLELGLVVRK